VQELVLEHQNLPEGQQEAPLGLVPHKLTAQTLSPPKAAFGWHSLLSRHDVPSGLDGWQV